LPKTGLSDPREADEQGEEQEEEQGLVHGKVWGGDKRQTQAFVNRNLTRNQSSVDKNTSIQAG
jgi:hypothetical protein